MTSDKDANGGRKFFRIPVDETSQVSISIGGKNYNVVNVAAGGVGIYLEDLTMFTQGDKVTNILLTIDETSCKVEGRIAHISPDDVDYLCGIEITNMDDKVRKLLKDYIDNHRASLFSFMPD